MMMRIALTAAVAMLLIHGIAHAELDESTRQTAIRAGFGLGCAVQDRDMPRANAWAQMMMGSVGALASRDMQRATEFGAYINGVMTEAARRGGFNCEGFPKLP